MGAQNNIDEIILEKVGKVGFFVEAGGSDPRDQNNTELLEFNGWSGLVVEPKTDFNGLYSVLRPKTIIENYVLVDSKHEGDYIAGDFSHYMMGGIINIHNFDNWNPINYPCITLDKLLLKHNISNVTFLSLDVEGYEKEVIDGINFERVFIDILVIELHSNNIDFSFLENYNFQKKMTIKQHEFFINKKSTFFNSF